MMAQNHSSVSPAKQYDRYIGLRAAEALGYFDLGHRSFKASYLCHFFDGQEFFESSDPTDLNRVQFVQSVVDPFQIGDAAVRFVPVDVVDHREAVRIGNKRNSDQTVDKECFASSFTPKTDLNVSKLIDARSKKLSVAPLRSVRSSAHPIDAAHAAKTADFVEVRKIGDRNESPFFGESDIHSTGCPSGYVGSAIKDPSFVATFGGSAYYGAASRVYQ